MSLQVRQNSDTKRQSECWFPVHLKETRTWGPYFNKEIIRTSQSPKSQFPTGSLRVKNGWHLSNSPWEFPCLKPNSTHHVAASCSIQLLTCPENPALHPRHCQWRTSSSAASTWTATAPGDRKIQRLRTRFTMEYDDDNPINSIISILSLYI